MRSIGPTPIPPPEDAPEAKGRLTSEPVPVPAQVQILAAELLGWRDIQATPAPEFRTVLLYRVPDLYPVVGCRVGSSYHLEEGGPEDGEHRTYPMLAYAPTHWAGLPALPLWKEL